MTGFTFRRQSVKKQEVYRRVKIMADAGMDLSVERSNHLLAIYNRKGFRKLSPNLPTRQLLGWLDAYQQGWEDRGQAEYTAARRPPT